MLVPSASASSPDSGVYEVSRARAVGIAILGNYASKEAIDLLVKKLELYKYNGCMDCWNYRTSDENKSKGPS